MFKKIFFYYLLLFSATIFSQKIRGFGGVSLFLDKQFEGSNYLNLSLGAEYKINQVIRPEIESSFFLGSLKTQLNYTDNGILKDEFERTFTAYSISICPKICLADEVDETGTAFIQILPIYSLTKVMAIGSQYTINQNDISKSTVIRDKYSEIKHSLGIGIGMYINGSKKRYSSLALNIYYHGIDFGNSISKLKYNNTNLSTENVLGMGIKYYFSFSKLKEN